MTGEIKHLHNPKRDELADLLQELSNREACRIAVSLNRLASTLRDAESAGLVGMVARKRGALFEINACKAKQGPCYDTGRNARYLGAAAAAFDDDNHLLFGDFAVCEKTAQIYQMPRYKRFVEVSQADPVLFEQLALNPTVFDCNTYERDLKTLLAGLEDASNSAEPATTAIFYPGPFRLLVTEHGALIRRGESVYICETQAEQLVEMDACIRLGPETGSLVTRAELLAEAVADRGLMCLLGDLPLTTVHAALSEPDLDSLDELSEETICRLCIIIENDDPMFILTGSDPSDPDGCCPSHEVGEALMLVDAGILDVRRSPAVPDGCPVMAFVFSGELRDSTSGIENTINQALRKAVYEKIS